MMNHKFSINIIAVPRLCVNKQWMHVKATKASCPVTFGTQLL